MSPTSGPGRGPGSDGRFRHRRPARPHGRVRPPGRRVSAQELRGRAQALFGERDAERRESGKAPPGRRTGENGTAVADGTAVSDSATVADGMAVSDSATVPDGMAVLDSTAVGDSTVVGDSTAVGGTGTPRAAGSLRERARLALRERMPLWLQTRCALERRGALALTVLLVAAAGLAVQHFWADRTQPVPAPEVVRAAAPYGGRGEPAEAARATGAPAAGTDPAPTSAPGAVPGAEIVVDVSGKVREPGIHRLPPGSRVADALRAAGGVRPGTDTDALNRARFLVDGEQIIVGPPPEGVVPGADPGVGSGSGPAGGAPGAAPAAPVSLSTATVDQLDTLPGVGPVLAGHIVEYRTQHGGFRSVDELREVNGIGERRYADLRDLVRP